MASNYLLGSWVSVLYLQKQMAPVTLSANDMAHNLSPLCRAMSLRNMPRDAGDRVGTVWHFRVKERITQLIHFFPHSAYRLLKQNALSHIQPAS